MGPAALVRVICELGTEDLVAAVLALPILRVLQYYSSLIVLLCSLSLSYMYYSTTAVL